MKMNTDLILPLALAFGSSVATWLGKDKVMEVLNIKKEESNLDGIKLDNFQKSLDLWQDMHDDIVRRHRIVVDEFEDTLTKVKTELYDLKQANKKLESIIKEQKELIEKQADIIISYKKKFEQ